MHRLIRALACAAIVAVGSARANMGANDTASSNPDFAAGRQAIEAQDWPGAIAALKKAVAADPNNADGHNWLGFAYRKSGNYDAAFSAYAEALRLEPRHRSAREYLGEAYLATKQLAKAEEQLAELTRLCTPIPCEEQKELRRAIDTYKKAHP